MRKHAQDPVNTEEVLRRIKLEISRRDSENDTDASAEPVQAVTGDIARVFIGPADLELLREYSCADFAQFHDARFIENATRSILGRLGGQGYLEALRSGKLTKIDILGRLRYSREGRLRGVRISGLLPMFILHTLFKVPVLGYLCETVFHLCRLPRLAQNQRMLEQQIANADTDLAVRINKILDAIEQEVNSSRSQ